MVAVVHTLGYLAPPLGLLGVYLLYLGITRDPAEIWLIRFGIPLIIFGLLMRPGRGHPLAAAFGLRGTRPNAVAKEETPEPLPVPEAVPDLGEPPAAAPSAYVPDVYPAHAPRDDAIKLIPARDGAQGRADSWLGGAPHLPVDMDWPVLGDVPMLFAAQISLAGLPDNLWQGLGPRQGSLALFLPDGGNLGRETRILHLTGPLEPRDWPPIKTGFDYGHKGNVARDILRAIQDGVAPHPPRFDLSPEAHRADPATRRPRPEDRAREDLRDEKDLRHAAITPFDRASALALVLAHARVQQTALNARTFREPQATLDSRAAALAVLKAVEATVLSEEEFTPEAADALFDVLSSIETEHVRSAANGGGIAYRPILRDPRARPAYLAAFEMLVQLRLRDDPESLPRDVLARFDAIWRADQARDYATMGGRPHGGYERGQGADTIFLLELTSSERLGWQFGDGRDLGLFIAADDLAQGRFDRAWADVST
ncbi:MAG: DUF1963 domain-containing protein [Pseudomonadota bacterium]